MLPLLNPSYLKYVTQNIVSMGYAYQFTTILNQQMKVKSNPFQVKESVSSGGLKKHIVLLPTFHSISSLLII